MGGSWRLALSAAQSSCGRRGSSVLLSRREKAKKESLDLLGKIATSVGYGGQGPPPSPPKPRSTLPPPPPKPAAPAPKAPAPKTPAQQQAERARRVQAEERRAKLEEERRLRERRSNELARSQSLQWRGMGFNDLPVGVRRTAYDRVEPDVSTKIAGVLGDPREKEGRAKQRERGRHQGGR